MNTNRTEYEVPEARTRHDSVATFTVLAAMLISVLSGAFVVDVDSSVSLAANAPAIYAAVEEARQ